MRLVLGLTMAAIAQLAPAHASCDQARAIWADNPGPNRTVVSYVKWGWNSHIRFERWEGQRLIWEIDGQILCSNGVVMCGLSVPLSNGQTLEAEFEEIASGVGPEYLVFAHLAQITYRAQVYDPDQPRLAVKWASSARASHDPISRRRTSRSRLSARCRG